MTTPLKSLLQVPPVVPLDSLYSSFSFKIRNPQVFRRFSDLLIIFFLLLLVKTDQVIRVSEPRRRDAITLEGSSEGHKKNIGYEKFHQFFMPAWISITSYDVISALSLPLMLPKKPGNGLGYIYMPLTLLSIESNQCSYKTKGISAGKFCNINGNRYLLKAATAAPGSEIITDAQRALNNYRLLGIVAISVPEYHMVYEAHGHYLNSDHQVIKTEYFLATKINVDFTSGDHLRNSATKVTLKKLKGKMDDKVFLENFRHVVIEKIGELGLSQLAVAGTFIQDLVYNEGNWGYDHKGLFIVDTDHSPSTVEEYYQEAYRMCHAIGLHFSLDTLRNMVAIYERILDDERAISVDIVLPISGIEFLNLVDDYLKSCLDALHFVQTNYPDLDETTPSQNINSALAFYFEQRRHEYLETVKPPRFL